MDKNHLKMIQKIYLLLPLLFLMPFSIRAEETFDADLMCTLIVNGTRIKDPNYCNTFIECIDQEPVYHSCGDQFYDHNTGQCVDPDTIQCLAIDVCLNKENGFYSDPYNCSNYYYCENGKGVLGNCRVDFYFDPLSKSCKRDFKCQITMYPEDYCNIVPDDVFIGDPNSCSAYSVCWKSNLVQDNCPDGLYFDPLRGVCDYESEVNCVWDTTLKPEIPDGVTCKKAEEFISDGHTCDGYFYCDPIENEDFDMIAGKCPVGYFFYFENQLCIARTNMTCSYDRCATMGLESIELTNIDADGCRGFAICQYGVEIARSECPRGQYFDEVLQLCSESIVTYPACVASFTTTTQNPDSNSVVTTTIDAKEGNEKNTLETDK